MTRAKLAEAFRHYGKVSTSIERRISWPPTKWGHLLNLDNVVSLSHRPDGSTTTAMFAGRQESDPEPGTVAVSETPETILNTAGVL